MHKMEAAELFNALGDPDRVKIMKMLCVRGNLPYTVLKEIITDDIGKLNMDLAFLKEKNLVSEDDGIYAANRELIDELMAFVTTPCGCVKA